MFTAKNIQILDSNNNNISPAVGLQSLYYEEEDGDRVYRRPIHTSVLLTDSSSYLEDSSMVPTFVFDVSIEEKVKAGVKIKEARFVKHNLKGHVVDSDFLNSSLGVVNSSIIEIKNSITNINSSIETLNSSVNGIEDLNLPKFDNSQAVNPKFVLALDPIEENLVKPYDISKLGTGGSAPVVDLDPYVMLSGQKPMTGDLKTKGLIPVDDTENIGSSEAQYTNGYIKNIHSEQVSTNELNLNGVSYTKVLTDSDIANKLNSNYSISTDLNDNTTLYVVNSEADETIKNDPLGIHVAILKDYINRDVKISTKAISDSSQYYILGSESSSGSTEKTFYKDSNIFMKKSGGIYYSSDARLKDNIKCIKEDEVSDIIDSDLDLIYTYKWKSTDLPGCGFIAQELMKAIPEAVNVNNATGYYSVDYNLAFSKVLGALLKRVREQDEEIKKLKAILNA